eukprot:m.113864 g.113864  ORF g.113864 m.113864 type:complete len:172 (+) comp16268_c0_seq1:202-717(+)
MANEAEPGTTDTFGVIPSDGVERQRLERAIADGVRVIAVEGARLGDETARAIQIGNSLHKTAVLSGVGCLLTASLRAPFHRVVLPLGACSVTSAALYWLAWQRDPLCKYQPDPYGEAQTAIAADRLKPEASYLFIVRRDDTIRKRLHNTITMICFAYCGWTLCREATSSTP